jgi:hypothetical protein
MRWSTRFTGRISQTSPLLLQNKTFITGMSSLEDKMAATTARSIAGIINTSGYVEENVFGAKPETGPFSRTAKIILSLLAL